MLVVVQETALIHGKEQRRLKDAGLPRAEVLHITNDLNALLFELEDGSVVEYGDLMGMTK